MPSSHNAKLVSHIDCPGGGQVWVEGNVLYIGHMEAPSGTSIVDISDPLKPKLMARIDLPQGWHSHKVRAKDGVMIVNHERNMSKIGRRAEQLPAARRALAEALKREPTREEIAARMSVTEDDLAMLEAFEQRGYDNGGFKIYDVSEPTHTMMTWNGITGGRRIHL